VDRGVVGAGRCAPGSGVVHNWSTALLAITCLTTPICFRYLHPLRLRD
jgi:hypothetical protein